MGDPIMLKEIKKGKVHNQKMKNDWNKVIYKNSQTGKDMHVNVHVYQQTQADEYKANLNMTMHQFADR